MGKAGERGDLKILSVVGARPQFVKAAVVSRHLTSHPRLREVMVHTGQHYDEGMSGRFFEELAIPEPHHNLAVGSGSHGRMTGRMLEGIEAMILQERPAMVLVYGDTNSTIAGALAAAKLHVPVAHVEAGLRSFNRRMPEEINRVLTDHASDLLFAPTETAVRHLAAEGLPADRVHRVGDIMLDAFEHFRVKAPPLAEVAARLGIPAGAYALVTLHRAENTDDPARLGEILEGLRAASGSLPLVWPMHPRTRAALEGSGRLGMLGPRITVLPPVGYLEMITLGLGSRGIVTDSGGVQKEAFFMRVPCVTLRDETEWTELVELGVNRVVPPKSAAVVADAIHGLRPFPDITARPYGDGHAGAAIVGAMARFLEART